MILAIFQLLPSLSTLSIESILKWAWRPEAQPQLFALIKNIRLSPIHNVYIDSLLLRILPILNHFPRIVNLKIIGRFQLFTMEQNVEHITHLDIQRLEVLRQRAQVAMIFLSTFKNVQKLRISLKYTAAITTIPIDGLSLTRLQSLYIKNLRVLQGALSAFLNVDI